MNLQEFEQIVTQVVNRLPPEFLKKLDNIDILVEDWPTSQDLQTVGIRSGLLFGLYRGVPHTQRGAHYSALPDKIVIFAGPILAVSRDEKDAQERIKKTVLHEIGHHFGMSEEQIRRAEAKMLKLK